jgi:hypothetical protein
LLVREGAASTSIMRPLGSAKCNFISTGMDREGTSLEGKSESCGTCHTGRPGLI